MQVEETDFRRSTDEQVYQKLGSNINFLLDEIASLITLSGSVFTGANMGTFGGTGFTSDSNGNFGGIIAETSNGNPITMALGFCYIGGYREVFCTVIVPAAGMVSSVIWSGNGVGGGSMLSIIPYASYQVIGPNNNQLYGQVVNGQMTSGSKTSPAWPGNTGGVFEWVLINQ